MSLFLLCLATFGASSMWLYSPGPEHLRAWWINNMGKLAPLAYCQLCCSFWIGFALHAMFIGLSGSLIFALGASGFSWMFGAITNAALWKKAYYEKKYNQEQ